MNKYETIDRYVKDEEHQKSQSIDLTCFIIYKKNKVPTLETLRQFLLSPEFSDCVSDSVSMFDLDSCVKQELDNKLYSFPNLSNDDIEEINIRMQKNYNLDDETIRFGDRLINVNDFVNKCAQDLEARKMTPLDFKKLSCLASLESSIDDKEYLKDVILPEHDNMSLAEVVKIELPFHMPDPYVISLKGSNGDVIYESIEDYINKLTEEARQIYMKQERDYNHVTDRPLNVPEMVISEDQFVTASIPVINEEELVYRGR